MIIHTDINAIIHNIKEARQLLNVETKLVFMVKADAYNHGMVEVAKYTEDYIDKFGVATANEGALLRENNIVKPIIVTAFSVFEAKEVIDNNLLPVVSSLEGILALEKYASLKKKSIFVDLKIDSGMNRYGLKDEKEINEVINVLKHSKLIKLRAIASHFHTAILEVMREQQKLFMKRAENIIQSFKNISIHFSASSGIELIPLFNYDEVRLGLLLYGYSPIKTKLNLIPAMTVTSKIEIIKDLKKGEKVGYSATYTSEKDTRIAIIRCGYYEGIDRDYKDSYVIINGTQAKIIGNISMDSIVVDLDKIEASVGDTVIILNDVVNADLIAQKSNTINYEILTRFKGRYERRYYV